MMSEETNLSDLLALNLHKFEDEVRNIVDKATKELSMEKTLKVCMATCCMNTILQVLMSFSMQQSCWLSVTVFFTIKFVNVATWT